MATTRGSKSRAARRHERWCATRSAPAVEPSGARAVAPPLAAHMAREHRYDALVSFGQPWSSHLVALTVRRSVTLPWIAHFSDPWSDADYVKWFSPRVRAYNAWLERRVVSTSDVVVFVNEHARRLYMRKYPLAWDQRAHVVPHAFE